MEITVAKSAGFCFGVDRAVKKVYELLDKGKKVYTLGPIIHNPQLVTSLSKRGVIIASKPSDVDNDAVLVIRSHGVARKIMEEIQNLNLSCENATCPFVSKIHKIVTQESQKGSIILIAGDESHPEVEGIRGHCVTESFVFSNSKELEILLNSLPKLKKDNICVVCQTTFDISKWKECLKIVKLLCTKALIFDTICNATVERQVEAKKLAQKSDLMIIIGGKQSSNTQKLKSVCQEYCKTILIETAVELPVEEVQKANFIGITAGASTPASIIKEALEVMTDILEQKDIKNNDQDDQNFEQMLEESLKNMNSDERVIGTVVGITPNEVHVDVGRKQAGFIPLVELTNDPSLKPKDIVKIGDQLDLLIMKTNDQEGTIMLSKKRIDSVKAWDDIIKASEEETVLEGKVLQIIKGGLIVLVNDMKIFVPASLATASRKEPIEDLLHKQVKLKVIEVNKNRRRAVGSIKAVLNDERKLLAEKFWQEVEIGKFYKGTVRSLTAYGAFVDLGGLDGMIHISDLSWARIKHPSDVVKVGDVVEVYIKDIDKEKGRVSLGFKRAEDNPWEILKKDYPIGTIVDATIVGFIDIGAFARILPGLDGLIHISQISEKRINKPQDVLEIGQEVKAMITDIDFDKKRVSLSIRKILEDSKKAESAEQAEENNSSDAQNKTVSEEKVDTQDNSN